MYYSLQGAHPLGKSQGNLVFLQGQGKVREFCKMVREIGKSSKVREFYNHAWLTPQKLNKQI